MNGFGSRLIMSQPEARPDIHPPMFDTTVAAQITANARLRNGAHAEATVRGGVAGGSVLAVGAPISVR
jgi:hypothetical protein